MSRPAPTATPLIDAMTGLSRSSSASATRWISACSCCLLLQRGQIGVGVGDGRPVHPRAERAVSGAGQHDHPHLVVNPGSVQICFHSWIIANVNAFRLCGRLSRMVPTPSRTDHCRSSTPRSLPPIQDGRDDGFDRNPRSNPLTDCTIQKWLHGWTASPNFPCRRPTRGFATRSGPGSTSISSGTSGIRRTGAGPTTTTIGSCAAPGSRARHGRLAGPVLAE